MRKTRVLAVGVLFVVSSIGTMTVAGHTSSGGHATAQLPPGHPAPGGSVSPGVPSSPPGSGTGTRGLTWSAPAGWTVETPASSMRRAQYRIPGEAGAAECVVFYFGPGQGGDAQANAARWASQFREPDGRPASKAPRTRQLDVGGLPVLFVETTGAYEAGMPGRPAGPARPDYMLLGAIVGGPDANWFFKATGPRRTLEAQRAAFERMILSVKRGTP